MQKSKKTQQEKKEYITEINHLKNLDGYIFFATEEFYPVDEFIELVKEKVDDAQNNQFLFADFSGMQIEGVDFSTYKLGGANFENSSIFRCTFAKVSMDSCNFNNAQILDCNFNEANIFSATFENAKLQNIYLNKANLNGVNFSEAQLNLCSFLQAEMNGIKAVNASFRNCFLSGAYMANSDLPMNKFIGCSFYLANLYDVDFRECDLTGSNFKDAELLATDFTNANLSSTDFNVKHMPKSLLSGADFQDANLPDAEIFIQSLDYYEAENIIEAENISKEFIEALIENRDVDYKERVGSADIEQDDEYTYAEILSKISEIGRIYINIHHYNNSLDTNPFDTNAVKYTLNLKNILSDLVSNMYMINRLPEYYMTKENFLKCIKNVPSQEIDPSLIPGYLEDFLDYIKEFDGLFDEDFYLEALKVCPEFIHQIPIEERTEKMAEIDGVLFLNNTKDWLNFFQQSPDKYPAVAYLLEKVENLADYLPENIQASYVMSPVEEDTARNVFYKLEGIENIEEVYTQGIVDNLLDIDIELYDSIPDKFKTYENTMKMLKKSGEYFYAVPDELKTKELCIAALKENIYRISAIPKKLIDDEVLRVFYENIHNVEGFRAVNEDYWEYVPEDMLVELVSKDTRDKLGDIPEKLRTERVCMTAVKQNGRDLNHVPHHLRTKELCWAAMQAKNLAYYAPGYTPKEFKTQEYWATALKHDGYALTRMIDAEPTEQMYLDAVSSNSEMLNNVPEEYLTAKMYKAAVFAKDGYISLEDLVSHTWKRESKIDLSHLKKQLKSAKRKQKKQRKTIKKMVKKLTTKSYD